MRITFVALSDATVASYRYHNQIPARELCMKGHEAKVAPLPDVDSDVYVFSKHFNYGDYWSAKGMKADGKTVAFHCCDNHFESEHKDHYKRMIDLSDIVIAPTRGMAEAVKRETGKEPIIIEDPYEYPISKPHFRGEIPMRVLWFGHRHNLLGLKPLLPLPDFCELRLCTIFDKGPLPMSFDKLPYMPWSLENMLKALEWADVVILPLDMQNPANHAKSANRLVEAARRGCFVVASPIPSYKEFEEVCYVGDVLEGLTWLKDQSKEAINEQIRLAQNLTENFSPSTVGEKWEKALCR